MFSTKETIVLTLPIKFLFILKISGLNSTYNSSLTHLNLEMKSLKAKLSDIDPVVGKLNEEVKGISDKTCDQTLLVMFIYCVQSIKNWSTLKEQIHHRKSRPRPVRNYRGWVTT